MLLSLVTVLLIPLAGDSGGSAVAAAGLSDSGGAVNVSTTDGLLAALQNDAVAEIVLTGKRLTVQRARQVRFICRCCTAGDLRLDQAADLGMLPIVLDRDVTIAGPGKGHSDPSAPCPAPTNVLAVHLAAVPFHAAAYADLDQPGVPHLDLSHIWPVLVAGGNVNFALQDLVVEGIPPYDAPDVALRPGYPGPRSEHISFDRTPGWRTGQQGCCMQLHA